MGQDQRTSVREAFRKLYLADREKGEVKDANAYKQLFPGYWDVVEEEYGRLHTPAETPRDWHTVTSGGGPSCGSAAGSPGPTEDHIGPYKILRELGRGGMGVVYEARDHRLSRRVALKVLSPQFASSPHLRLRFRREAELASKLDHPHICTVYEAGEDGGTPYLAMRYVEGRPLSDLLASTREQRRTTGVVHVPWKGEAATAPGDPPPARTRSGETRLDLDRVLALFEKAARALHHAHERGLIHRDIKPHNIMVTADGEPVLLDFGLAREEEGEGHQLTQTGSLMGTPAYMSPEQLTAQRIRLDRRTDVFSLGVSLYECLTLKLPFEAPTVDKLYQRILMTDPEDPRRLNRDLPEDLKVVLDAALEKDRDRRYQTAEALAEELRRVREHEPIRARPVGPLGRLARWSRRSPGMAASVSALFLSLTGGLALSLNFLKAARLERDAKEYALDAERKASETARRERDAKEEARAATQGERDAKERALGETVLALEENRRNLRTARALAIASASNRALEADGMRALLLAREAVRLEPNRETVSQLHETFRGLHEAATLRGHQGPLLSTAFSPGGDRILTGSKDGTVRLWDLQGREQAVLRGHSGDITDAVFSPAGDRILTLGCDGTARLWDLEGRTLATTQNVAGGAVSPVPIGSCRFSPLGDRILTAHPDGTARLWDLEGRETAVLRGHAGWVTVAEFSPSGDRILTASLDGTARLWDPGGRELAVLKGHEGVLAWAAFSPRGDLVATCSQDMTARIWDLEGNEKAVLRGHEKSAHQQAEVIARVVFSPSGDRVLTAAFDKTARLWDLQGRELAVFRGHKGPLIGAAFSPSGDDVLTVSTDGTARLWDLGGRERLKLVGHSGAVLIGRFSPSGSSVLTASLDGTARLWDLEGEELPALRGHSDFVLSAEYSPRGDRLLTAACDGTARLWDLDGREKVVFRGHGKAVMSASFSPSGERVVTSSLDETARVWDVGGKELVVLRGHKILVSSAVFSPSGDRILTASQDATARLWDLEGKEVAVLKGHKAHIRTAVYSSDGSRILTASLDNTLRLWDREGRQQAVLVDLGKGGQGFWAAAFSPSGELVLGAMGDGTAAIWDLAGKQKARMAALDSAIRFASFSHSGDRVLTSGNDGTVRMWDLEGKELLVLPAHEDFVNMAVFSPADDRIATASGDHTVRQWVGRSGDLLALADARITREFTPLEVEKYADVLGSDHLLVRAGRWLRPWAGGSPPDAGVLDTENVEAMLRLTSGDPKGASILNDCAWRLCAGRGSPADRCTAALRLAGEAVRRVPESAPLLNTLGVAQYRAGEHARALETLRRSDSMNQGMQVADVAFLAMALHRLGRREEALKEFERLKALMGDPRNARNEESRSFFDEAQELLGGPKAESPSAK